MAIKFLNTVQVDTDVLYVNTANDRVGIGTTNPSVTLHVDGFARLNGGLQMNATNAQIYQILDSDLRFGTNNTERMRIDNTGNVGIGTTSPARALHVSDSSDAPFRVESTDSTTGIQFKDPDGNNNIYYVGNGDYFYTSGNVGIGESTPSSKLEVRSETATHKLVSLNRAASTTAAMYLGNDSSNNAIISSNYSDLIFGRDQSSTLSEWMRIKRDGNVGIGTTAPEAKLHINGANLGSTNNDTTNQAIFSATNTNASKLYIQDYRTADGSDWTTSGKRIQEKIDSTWMGYIQFNGDSNNGGISFGTGTNSTQGNVEERMRINSTGNVGIGTTSPGAKLNVVAGTGSPTVLLGRATGQASIKADTDSSGHLIIDSSTGHVYINNYVNKNIYLANGGGNVGIGTTSPRGKLDVVGNTDNDSDFLTIQDNDLTAGSSRPSIRFRSNTAQIGQIVGLNGRMRFSSGTTEDSMLEILDNGNVGIGTTSPGYKLDVNGDIRGFGSVKVNSAADGDPYLALYQNGTEKAYFQYVDSGDNLVLQSDGIFTFKTATAERVRITTGGRVGIGVTNPSAKLQVEDSANNIQMRVGSLTAGRSPIIRLQGKNSANTTNYYADIELDADDGKLIFNDPGTSGSSIGQNPMVLDSSGNVGIGITSPLNPLSIESSSSPLIKIRCTTNGSGAAIEFNDNGTSAANQNGRITYYHSDSASQGGGSSYWLTGENDQTLVLANNGRVVVQKSGSASEVGYGFYDDVDTGMYHVSADALGFATGGTRRLDMNSSGVRIGTGSRVTTILDEDNMSSNSNTALATQQSIKAYVDNEIAGVPQGTVTSVTATAPILSSGGATPIISARVPANGDWWNGGLAQVATDGVMEVGKYIDMHATDAATSDYDVRLTAATGSLSVSGDIVIGGGDITLNGTGRIQGVDTVSASTDAVNKAYVDAQGTNFLQNEGAFISGDTLLEILETDTTEDVRVKLNKSTTTTIERVDDPTAPAGGCFQLNNAYVSFTLPQFHKIDDDQEYTFELWGKFISGTDTNQLNYLGSSFYGSTKNYLGNSQRYWGESGFAIDSNSNNDGWYFMSGTLGPERGANTGQIPTAANWMKLIMLLNYSSQANTVRYCGLKVYKSGHKGAKKVTSIYRKSLGSQASSSAGQWIGEVVMDTAGALHAPNITLADGIYHKGDTNTYINFLTDTIQMATAGSPRVYINSGGDVGIGTTNPQDKLEVLGNIRLSPSVSNAETVYISTNSRGTGTNDADLRLGNSNSGDVLTVHNTNVGIGTTSPGANLEVAGNTLLDGRVYINATTSIPNRTEDFQVTGRQIITNTGTDGPSLDLGYNSSGSVRLQLGRGRTADGLAYMDFNGEVMPAGSYGFRIIRNSGANAVTQLNQVGTGNLQINASNGADTVFTNTNVGIGTTSPAAKLEVQGSAPFIYITDDTETESGIIFRDLQADMGQAAAIKFSSSDNKLRFYNNDTAAQRMVIDTAGNVGIGTDSPSATLDVNGEIGASGDGYYINGMAWALELSSVLTLGDWDGNEFETRIMDENSTEVLRVANGKVGIGRTSPGYTLDVLGNARFTGGLVTSSSQTRDKISVWNSLSSYTIGMKSGFGYGGLGGDSTGTDFAMSFQMSNTANRGWWWGDTTHTDLQGAMSLTTQGKLVVATSIKVGAGESTRSAGTSKLTVVAPLSSGGIGTDFQIDGGSGFGMKTVQVEIPAYGDGIRFNSVAASNLDNNALTFYQDANKRGSIVVNATSTSYNTTSDYRLKENKEDISGAIERVKLLKPVKFNWISQPNQPKVDGFYAHELAEVVPEAVTGEKDALDYEDNPDYQSIDQSKIVPLLAAALQQAIDKIEILEQRIQLIENK